MERPMVLQQPPQNALEAVLRYTPMPAWPQDTTRAGSPHRSGDPGVLSQLGNLARRFRGLHILECSACGPKHDDFVVVFNRINRWSKPWEGNEWYAANVCQPCEARYSSPHIDPSTHIWCKKCLEWISRRYPCDCSHICYQLDYTYDSS